MHSFIKGALLGFSIAAPVGPIGLLCIQQSLARGRLAGLACGLGAATADAAYGAVAAFGLSAVSGFLIHVAGGFQLLGGLFLVYLGAVTIRQAPAAHAAHTPVTSGNWGRYAATFGLTLANPTTILSFIAAFAGLGLTSENRTTSAALAMVSGVFAGSAFWWLLLSQAVGALGAWFTPSRLCWVNRFAGAFLIAFGVWQIVAAAKMGFLDPGSRSFTMRSH